MTTAALEKRVTKLEEEIRRLKIAQQVRPTKHPMRAKKLPRGVIEGLRDFEAGRYSGPFNTVGELMAHLNK
ncbi:MAG: hypothetical protein Q7R54_03135 [bacterium]|nr:hypothetical protein [bacterium]